MISSWKPLRYYFALHSVHQIYFLLTSSFISFSTSGFSLPTHTSQYDCCECWCHPPFTVFVQGHCSSRAGAAVEASCLLLCTEAAWAPPAVAVHPPPGPPSSAARDTVCLVLSPHHSPRCPACLCYGRVFSGCFSMGLNLLPFWHFGTLVAFLKFLDWLGGFLFFILKKRKCLCYLMEPWAREEGSVCSPHLLGLLYRSNYTLDLWWPHPALVSVKF